MWLMLCAPSAPLLCPKRGLALGIPCARFIAHFASGLHFNPTFHSLDVLPLQQTEDMAPCACPPPPQHHKAQEAAGWTGQQEGHTTGVLCGDRGVQTRELKPCKG